MSTRTEKTWRRKMAKARAARPPTILIQPKRWTEADAAAAFWMERIANTPAVSL